MLMTEESHDCCMNSQTIVWKISCPLHISFRQIPEKPCTCCMNSVWRISCPLHKFTFEKYYTHCMNLQSEKSHACCTILQSLKNLMPTACIQKQLSREYHACCMSSQMIWWILFLPHEFTDNLKNLRSAVWIYRQLNEEFHACCMNS